MVDDRQERVPQHVLPVDDARRHPLRAGGADVVLVLDVERGRARDAGDDRERDRAERDRRQDQVPDRVPEGGWIAVDERVEDVEVRRVRPVGGDRLAADARQPAELDRERPLEHQAEEEDRDRDAEQRDHQARVVEPGAVALGRHEAERDPERDREHHRRDRELDRRREAVRELVGDGSRRDDAVAEVAVGGLLQVVPVLQPDRLVEPVLVADLARRAAASPARRGAPARASRAARGSTRRSGSTARTGSGREAAAGGRRSEASKSAGCCSSTSLASEVDG